MHLQQRCCEQTDYRKTHIMTIFSVYINGDWHVDVEAIDEDAALTIVFDRGIGFHVKEVFVELCEVDNPVF